MHVVTNARFAPDFNEWARDRGVKVHDDGTTSNEDRLGAIGDIAFVADREGWDGEDVLVVAGDNLFEFSLAEYVDFWRAKDGSAIAVYEHPEPGARPRVQRRRARRRRLAWSASRRSPSGRRRT